MNTARKESYSLFILFLLILFLWNSSFIYPLKLFVVLLHELSHGTAALITGGKIIKIELSKNLGGKCYTQGGIKFLVISAGYIGSIIFGGIILVIATKSKYNKKVSFSFGILLFILTVLFVRGLFGLLACSLFALFFILAGKYFTNDINKFILKFVGITSCLYAIIDIKEDLIVRTVPGSDAFLMSKEILALPPIVWGIFWIIIALLFTYLFIKLATTS